MGETGGLSDEARPLSCKFGLIFMSWTWFFLLGFDHRRAEQQLKIVRPVIWEDILNPSFSCSSLNSVFGLAVPWEGALLGE